MDSLDAYIKTIVFRRDEKGNENVLLSMEAPLNVPVIRWDATPMGGIVCTPDRRTLMAFITVPVLDDESVKVSKQLQDGSVLEQEIE